MNKQKTIVNLKEVKADACLIIQSAGQRLIIKDLAELWFRLARRIPSKSVDNLIISSLKTIWDRTTL